MAQRVDRARLLASVGIAFGLVLVVVGFRTALTGDDARTFPDAIERMSPADGDRVLRQAQIIIDFVVGYEATLTIDGIALPVTRLDELSASGGALSPGSQVELPPTAVYDPGNHVLSFQPQMGALIEEFSQGEHIVVVTYWKTLDGPEKSRTYQWRFITD